MTPKQQKIYNKIQAIRNKSVRGVSDDKAVESLARQLVDEEMRHPMDAPDKLQTYEQQGGAVHLDMEGWSD